MKIDDVPKFADLFRGYFHQDWDVVSGPDWTDVVDDVVATERRDDAMQIMREIDVVLDNVHDDQELVRLIMEDARSDYIVAVEDVRAWLTAVRNRLAAALGA